MFNYVMANFGIHFMAIFYAYFFLIPIYCYKFSVKKYFFPVK
ncbi:hypothetical protein HOLDEFILI_03627 [Holdemania filiformis DSM 12042]|uniref:Uncharacterized protein n=1 Tax=Holdemania filiformis DSM 12042 TaxID=545696 RepID=B9YCR6_9FIRM|nr:hypothetical protein HOLDEFILI_03627 [Holdemania filiformis DSM 12042]